MNVVLRHLQEFSSELNADCDRVKVVGLQDRIWEMNANGNRVKIISRCLQD